MNFGELLIIDKAKFMNDLVEKINCSWMIMEGTFKGSAVKDVYDDDDLFNINNWSLI